MGNKGNKANKSETVIQEQQIDLDHSKLKDMKFKKTRGGEYMEGSFVMHNKDDFKLWEQQLAKNPGASSSDVLNPKKVDFKENKMCGSGGKTKVIYDTFPFLLNYEITNRANREQKQKFQESQLWYLLHTLASVGDQYHQAGQKVGNISPENVFLNDNGVINIASKYSWPHQKTNYEDAFYDKQITYLAPEETKDLEIGRNAPLGDFRLAESFSAGLTALDASLLENSKKLYSNPRGFDEEMLQGKKQNLRNQPYYNDELKHLILNLTQLDPNKRMTLSEVKNWLGSHSQSITNLQGFRPNTYTQKLAETARRYPVREKTQIGPQGFYKTNSSNNYPLNMPVSSATQIKKMTKTFEIPGGPVQSSRPRKNPKQVSKNKKRFEYPPQNSQPTQRESNHYRFETRSPMTFNRQSNYQEKRQSIYQLPSETRYQQSHQIGYQPAQETRYQPVQEKRYQVLQQTALYQPSQSYRLSSDVPKTKTSLETIEQKIRRSRMNFPDV